MGGTCARWCGHTHTRGIVNIYEAFGDAEGGRMKNHWQISDGLCAAPRSREFIGNASCDCWRRTSAEQRRHASATMYLALQARVLLFPRSMESIGRPRDRPEVSCGKKFKRLVDLKKDWREQQRLLYLSWITSRNLWFSKKDLTLKSRSSLVYYYLVYYFSTFLLHIIFEIVFLKLDQCWNVGLKLIISWINKSTGYY